MHKLSVLTNLTLRHGEMTKIITDHVILPLGSPLIQDITTDSKSIRSILLYSSVGVGKVCSKNQKRGNIGYFDVNTN